MTDSYVATGEQNVLTTDITALVVSQTASPTRRAGVYYLAASAEGTPADFLQGIIAQRTSAAGTDTPVVPAPLNGGPASTLTASGEDHSVEPTYTSATELFDQKIHMRSLLQYHARVPWLIPSTANNGIGILLGLDSTRTDLWKVQVEWEE